MSGRDLWEEIATNEELVTLEHEGFERGKAKGKTMNVSLNVLIHSLNKQWNDFLEVDGNVLRKGQAMKVALADLRNVAGCVFLKIQEIEKKVT